MATRTDDRRTVPETHRDILEKNGLAHVATIGPGGEPQSSPVWYGYDGRTLNFSHTKDRQKYRNLLRDPRISVSIADPDNQYRYLEIRGTAEIEDDPEKGFIDVMWQKYLGKDNPGSRPGEERVIVRVHPLHVHAGG